MGDSKDNPAALSCAVLAVVVALALLPQLYLFSHITDDAYISFRYADRLARGQGLTFNPAERVEGFSNPLWTLLIAAAIRLSPFAAPEIARVLGISCSLLTILCAWRIFGREQTNTPAPLGNFALFAALLLANPGFHIYMTAGLEGPLLMLLATAGVGLTLNKNPRSQYLAAVAFGLLSITRPEGLLYGLLWFAFTCTLKNRTEPPKHREAIRLALLLAPWLIYELFRLLYFEALLPNTFAAKPPGVFGGDTLAVRYCWPWIAALGGIIPIVIMLLLKARQSEYSKTMFRICAGPLIAALIFVMYARGDWMPFARFIAPVWPVVCLCITVWIHSAIGTLNEHSLIRLPGVAKAIVAMALIFSSLLTWADPIIAYAGNKEMNMLMRGNDQIAVGEWLTQNVREGTTIATIRLGGISYAAPKMIFWDLNGLTDKEEAQFVAKGRLGGAPNDPVLNRFPKILAMVEYASSQRPENAALMRKWVEDHYTFIRSFRQGNFGKFDIWILKNASEVMLDNSQKAPID